MRKEILKFVLKKNMSDKNKYTGKRLSDFLRYQRGEMTKKERNLFERELQKDPFANEASEGFESLSPSEISSDLNIIELCIPKAKTHKRGLVVYRIAASVAVLMVISTIFILVERNRPVEQIAKSEKPSEPFEISEGEPLMQNLAENIKTKPGREISQIMGEVAASGGAAKEIRQETIPTGAEDRAKKDLTESDKNIGVKQEKIYLAEEIIAAPAPMAKAKSVSDSRLQMNSDTSISSLDELVVVGYGVSRKNESETGYTAPQPVTGRAAFDKYIEENILRPDTITEGQRAAVVINFTVLSDGRIDSIKIIRTPGKQFSDEAIRLIKSGPQWKPAEVNGKTIEDEVRVRIVFR